MLRHNEQYVLVLLHLFYYKYNLPLTTLTYIKDLNEVFFHDGAIGWRWPSGALTKLCRILEENNITYKEYFDAISITKEDLYTLIAYIKMQGEWRDQLKYFKEYERKQV